MGFTYAAKSGFVRCFDYRGRSSRSEYWWWFLFTFVAGFVAGFVGALSGEANLANALVALALFLPNLSMNVRRLHDIDRSGWWFAGFLGSFVLFMVVLIAVDGKAAENVVAGAAALALVAGWIVFLVWMCRPGIQGENRFGPDPKASSTEQINRRPVYPHMTIVSSAEREQPSPVTISRDLSGQGDAVFTRIGKEIETGSYEPAAWARALMLGHGDDTRTKSEYVSLRLTQLKQESTA